jgi:hypothetical protein
MNDENAHTMIRRLINIFGNVVLLIMSLIVGSVLFEIGMRLTGHATVQASRAVLAPQFYYEADPVNGYDIAKNFSGGLFILPDYVRAYGAPFGVSSNNLGCRDRPFDRGADYVLLLGDSFTWGYVELEQTWGTTLEQLIGMRVLKCGVGGYGTHQERNKLKAIVAQAGKPRLVVVGHTAHDLMDDYIYPGRTVVDGYLVPTIRFVDEKRGDLKAYSEEEIHEKMRASLDKGSSVKDFLADHSVVYDRLRSAEGLRQIIARYGLAEAPSLGDPGIFHSITEYPWLDKAWKEHLENLQQMKSEVEAAGATLVVALIPERAEVYESLRPPGRDVHWEYPHQRLTEFFQQKDIAYVDLLSDFRRYARCNGSSKSDTQDDLYWAHDGHLNVKGNRLAGLHISREVLQQSIMKSADSTRRLSNVDQLLKEEERCPSGSPI